MVGGLHSIGVIDVLDILLVAFIIYWILLFIRGTRAVQILFGLLILVVMYIGAKKAGMVTFQWLVGNFLDRRARRAPPRPPRGRPAGRGRAAAARSRRSGA